MSKREWKPGDVAIVRRNGKEVVAMRYDTHCEQGWRYQAAVGTAFDHFDPDDGTAPRPLVVIDPEDREQVERLWALYRDTDDDDARDGMQTALREFANPKPPKPDEPTGLGAVVEDADGKRWIRVTEGDVSPWAPLGNVGFFVSWRRYRQINAVRVLSEGVTQ